MSARTEALQTQGTFGLQGVRLAVVPGAELDGLLFDALVLAQQALAVFEAMTEAEEEDAQDMLYSGLYLLRQSATVLNWVQLTHEQAVAATTAGWSAP